MGQLSLHSLLCNCYEVLRKENGDIRTEGR